MYIPSGSCKARTMCLQKHLHARHMFLFLIQAVNLCDHKSLAS